MILPFDPQKYRQEKEKEINQIYGNMRKRSFKFLFVNIMIVISIFVFILFVQRVSPQTYLNIVDSLQLTIELTKLEYKAPEKVGAKVYIVNTKKTNKNFVLSDFYLKIYSPEKTFYEFSYPTAIESSIEGLSNKLVYNLENEVTLLNLPSGTYTIYARCKINGKQAEIYRTFTYTEEISYSIYTEPFYILTEQLKPSLVIWNRTSKIENISIRKIIWSFQGNDYVQSFDKETSNVRLYPGESYLIPGSIAFTVDKAGDLELSAKIYLASGEIKDLRTLVYSAKKTEEDVNGIDFSIEVEEPIVVNKSAKVNVYISNKLNTKRFIIVDNVNFSIPKIGYNFEIGNRRVMMIQFGRSFLSRLEKLNFTQPGIYELLITLSMKGQKIQKKITIAVGK
ncbi:MAG: hypothetical protein ACP5PP_00345 [Fervidobacterium sp.]